MKVSSTVNVCFVYFYLRIFEADVKMTRKTILVPCCICYVYIVCIFMFVGSFVGLVLLKFPSDHIGSIYLLCMFFGV